MQSQAIYIDVDDTLVRSFGSKRMPIASTVVLVRRLFEAGGELYLWSRGGAEYSRTTARDLGIEDCFRAFLPKPEVMIDDMPFAQWPVRELHPNEALAIDVERIVSR